MLVICQIVRVWQLEINGNDPTAVYRLQTTEIEERGKLLDITVDHAEDAKLVGRGLDIVPK